MGNAIQKIVTAVKGSEKLAPEYLSDPDIVKQKAIHGPNFIPVSDPNYNDDQVMLGKYRNNHPFIPGRPNNPGVGQAQDVKHPDINSAKPGRGNHSVQLGG